MSGSGAVVLYTLPMAEREGCNSKKYHFLYLFVIVVVTGDKVVNVFSCFSKNFAITVIKKIQIIAVTVTDMNINTLSINIPLFK